MEPIPLEPRPSKSLLYIITALGIFCILSATAAAFLFIQNLSFEDRVQEAIKGKAGASIRGPQGRRGLPGKNVVTIRETVRNVPVEGPRGPRGFTGARGPRGFRGFQGIQGLRGLQGLKGSAGIIKEVKIPGIPQTPITPPVDPNQVSDQVQAILCARIPQLC